MVAAAVSTTPNPKVLSRGGPAPAATNQKPKRAPLLPSPADNGPLRTKSTDVTSRYLPSSSSPTTSSTSSSSSSSSSSNSNSCTPRRFPSPHAGRTFPMTPTPSPAAIKRSQSAERRRPVTPSAAAKLLVTSSRSLSVSFQGESFKLPISKVKPAPALVSNSLRSGTPERRKVVAETPGRVHTTENSKPIDPQRWPVRSGKGNFLTRSVDLTGEKTKLSGSGSVGRALPKSMIDETRLIKPNKRENVELERTVNNYNSDPVASDTESISSGSNSAGPVRGGGPRGIMVPARFWQETVSRIRPREPVSPVSKNNKLISAAKSLDDCPILSPRGSSSPLRGAVRPTSPSKRVISSTSSPSRGMPSPSRARNGGVGSSNSNLGNAPSILSFAAEARRGGKVGENKFADAHVLRLLHNKHLQWRFTNARADAAMLVQRASAEKSLYNAWVAMTKLWHSVISKGIEIQLLRQNLKLYSILKKQIPYLDDWDLTDTDHSISLSGATVALESSTLRLPVVGGAKANIQNLKDAICSAVDVMQAMASSICSLQTKVEDVNSLASELATTTVNECALLDQGKDLLSKLTLVQVEDCSLRTHILQLHSPSSIKQKYKDPLTAYYSKQKMLTPTII